ncbi:hypothetical protein SASPL_156430 [Salvia splendens]|uniref:Uncharacterized protein n=1 Tax=Salvia splendens TaxID=180675 RepID=A0A8X8YWU3_SALSN|nr:hypothetical protein SASPL_156430 [Salvia splendens]
MLQPAEHPFSGSKPVVWSRIDGDPPPMAVNFSLVDAWMDRRSRYWKRIGGLRVRRALVLPCDGVPSMAVGVELLSVKVVAMRALALALCNADRVVMSVAIVPLLLWRAGGTLVDRYGGKVVYGYLSYPLPWAAESSLLALLATRMLLCIAEGVALPCMNNMIASVSVEVWKSKTELCYKLFSGGFLKPKGSAIGPTLSPILMSQAGIYGPFVIFG